MNYSEIAKRLNLRITMPRTYIYNVLASGPMTFQQLTAACQRQEINTSTVYRIIETFKKHSLLSESGSGTRRILQLKSSIHSNHVHHLRCEKCGDITSFHDEELEERLRIVAGLYNLSFIAGHIVEISGICMRCQNREKFTSSVA